MKAQFITERTDNFGMVYSYYVYRDIPLCIERQIGVKYTETLEEQIEKAEKDIDLWIEAQTEERNRQCESH